ncbi:transglycosylase SLT domain-containing protein [Usitatibacter palustris]|uniref:transglycosylase SLT domain-containing protein n=1 Tax=Usitatibacter palustris TaxID=2732487 RepID=UPI001488FD84|nr:transglycosylase SLT domain-containing protein [Usitatibacter palustris]
MKQPLKYLAVALALAWAGPALSSPVEANPVIPDAFEDIDDVPLPDPDLWHRIRVGFVMEPLDSPRVQEAEAWYAARPDYIKRFVDRGSLYLHYIVGEVQKRGMPMEIALLPVVESAFNPHAYSRSKASGLWQFIPSTGKSYGLSQDWWKDNRRDVVSATDAALTYLQRLHSMFNSWELALAAYNCGEGCVGRAIAANQKKGLPTDYLSLKLPPETLGYVPKLMAVKNIVLSPTTYGIDLESVPDQAYFTAVPAPEKIDVKLAAKLAGMSEEEFVALNPSNNNAVAIARTGTLLVPLDKADAFRSNLEGYDKPLVTWTTVQGKKGESLNGLAARHGVAAHELRAANGAVKLNKKGNLVATQSILVPAKGAAMAKAVPAVNNVKVASATPVPIRNAPQSYVVRPGDTLYGIALRFEAELEELLSLNKLTPKSVIQPGLKLRLP